MSQGPLIPKIMFSSQKLWPVASDTGDTDQGLIFDAQILFSGDRGLVFGDQRLASDDQGLISDDQRLVSDD